ncbi:glutaredoxin family protein [Microbacterium indicum]|uniref:glutaredoxin family protein n=1 Tax=Microbacterium indicum TaxID=358100 RepID=UPI0004079A18|nr:glutaredoxin family protein [Microbacterium indicum]
MTDVTIISKPDCHLCDVAREVVEHTIAELPDAVADAIEVRELSIAEDRALYDEWWEKVPVVLIDGELHGHWRVSPDRLRDALTKEKA